MRKTTRQSNTLETSFFQKKDMVKTEKYGNSETFESPKRHIEQVGEASLLFTKFDEKDIESMYSDKEKVYGIDSFGKFMLANARELAQTQMFEVMVMLRTDKKYTNEQMICNLWIKDHDQVFSTYMDNKSKKKNKSVLYLGGFTWWSSEETNMHVKKLLLPNNMNILSNICINVATLPKNLYKKELDDDIDDMFFW
jgi:hypothetical protein